MTCQTCGMPCSPSEGYDGRCNACTYATLPPGYSLRPFGRTGHYVALFHGKRIVHPDPVYGGTAFRTFPDPEEAIAYCVDHAHGAFQKDQAI